VGAVVKDVKIVVDGRSGETSATDITGTSELNIHHVPLV
jgi:hypothetical protein